MDYSKAIEIAPDIYWIGYVIPDDPFQCHVYLIKNGNESILIDPGSMITFPVVLEKITSIMPLRDIKYIIMHHQDPDIVGCYSTLEKLFPKGVNRYIVTHWRTEMLLKHYQWKTPFYLIDQNDWKLKAGDRELEFVFTPYAHFPGAFCTYDKKSKILFSSDLFGGLTPEFELFAKNADEYFEYAKPFHKHYIPSKEILNYALDKIEQKNVSMIAPQHGSIIKKEIINPLIEKLRELDCGLYLMDDYYDDILILDQVDEVLKNVFKEALLTNSFENILKALYSYIIERIPQTKSIIIINDQYSFKIENFEIIKNCKCIDECKSYFSVYLNDENNSKIAELKLCYDNKLEKKDIEFLNILFKKINNVLGVALKKEIMILNLKRKEEQLYEKSITDALTSLYNRYFLEEFLNKKLLEAKRYNFPLSIAIIDIDFFKKINDTYGHLTGDCVLQEISLLLKKYFRGSDIVARYGGEEFVVVMPFTKLEDACKKMDEFRKIVQSHEFCIEKLKVTVSVGVSELKKDDSVVELIKRTDENLYEAKESGRNKVVCKE